MQVFGLMIVRNEADIVRVNVLHHLAVGVDRFLIVDNGSEDGTDQILHDLSRGGRVAFTRFSGPYRQAEITTQLALEAYRRGADWVIPIDADEFWYAPGGDLRGVLTESIAGALGVQVVNFIQRMEQREASADALLHMTWRAPKPVGPLDRVQQLVCNRANAFVEMMYPPKWISRASLALHIGVGNHEVMGVPGPFEETDAIVCLHAPLRSRSVFHAQVAHARRAVEAGNLKTWHWERWKQLAEKGELDLEWRANSYEEGCLDVYGLAHPLVLDLRLRNLAAPWLDCDVNSGQAVASPSLKLDSRFGQCEPDLVGPVLASMNRIEGWFTDAEAHVLMFAATLALLRSPHAVVEVGSYCGRSTVVLGSVVKAVCPTSRVYAIDPHEGETAPGTGSGTSTLERLQTNIKEAGLNSVVEAVRKRSFDVPWNRTIGFLFIDGFHDYLNTSRDFLHFQGWLSPGSYVAFHDYSNDYPDVRTFVAELLACGAYREFQLVDNLMVLEKNMKGAEQESSEPRELASRLERQDRGIAVLRNILRDAITRSRAELAGRDRLIVDLQQELFRKVDERDRIIRDLQAELHQKVGECNRIIRELQAELHAKVGERDKIILELQSSLDDARRRSQN
jgi:Glycosyl transferase family 2/Methyltransferase domain